MAKLELNSTDGIRKAIKSVVGRAVSVQRDVQKIAVACLEHTHKHGDWTLSVELIQGISKAKGVRKTALINYTQAFMRATYKKQANGEMGFTYDEGADKSTILLEAAREVNWFDFKPEREEKTHNMDSVYEVAEKEMAKAIKQGNMTKENATELLAALSQSIESELSRALLKVA
jgi:hypothetical protein